MFDVTVEKRNHRHCNFLLGWELCGGWGPSVSSWWGRGLCWRRGDCGVEEPVPLPPHKLQPLLFLPAMSNVLKLWHGKVWRCSLPGLRQPITINQILKPYP